MIGLLVYAPRIYNIFAKRYYRYPKDFVISVGQEINPKVLYPIYFGLEPLRESKLIMRELDIKVAQRIGNKNEEQIAAYFTGSNSDTCKIDRVKLIEAIEHTTAKMREKGKNKLRLYTPVLIPEKEIINQLIINNYIMRLLDLDEAKPTKAAFNLIKTDILSPVDLDMCLQDGLCIFSVNKARLESELKKHGINNYKQGENTQQGGINPSLRTSQHQPSEIQIEQEGLETKLLSKTKAVSTQSQLSNANIDMLIYAIEAFAFNQYIIDADIDKINIVTKQKLVNNIWALSGIKRILKWDLEPTNLIEKGRVGCGIKYNIQENCLSFYGTANKDIKDKTIVMQIVSRREKILREIWIHGIDGG